MISVRSGTSAIAGGRPARSAHRRPAPASSRRPPACRAGTRVALERRVRFWNGMPHPPREHRVVAVVEVEPRSHAAAEALDGIGGANGHGRGRAGHRGGILRKLRLQRGDVCGDPGQRAGSLACVDALQPNPRLGQIDERCRERQQRHHLGDCRGIGVELLEVGLDGRLQRPQIRGRCRRELRRIDVRQRRLPVHLYRFRWALARSTGRIPARTPRCRGRRLRDRRPAGRHSDVLRRPRGRPPRLHGRHHHHHRGCCGR